MWMDLVTDYIQPNKCHSFMKILFKDCLPCQNSHFDGDLRRFHDVMNLKFLILDYLLLFLTDY